MEETVLLHTYHRRHVTAGYTKNTLGESMKKLIMLMVLLIAGLAFASSTEWTYVNTTDPFTDTNNSFVVLDSQQATDYSYPVIVVRCNANVQDGYEIYVAFDEYLNNNEDVPVIYRFDKNSPVRYSWSVSTDGTAVFAHDINKATLLANLQTYQSSFVIRATDYDGQDYTLSFNAATNTQEVLSQLPCLNK